MVVRVPARFLYPGVLYVIALALYAGFRPFRRTRGVELNMVYSEIPED